MKPVIVIVAYRRVHTLKRLLNSIQNAVYHEDSINLIISIDYAPNNADVIKCAEDFSWLHGTKVVKTHEENLGLRRHIIECGDYALKYGAAIILEDDEIVAPSFYEFTKKAQGFYANNNEIAGVSLYSHEWNGYAGKKFQPIYKESSIYFGQFSCTWGESWTARQWEEFKKWYSQNPQIKKDELLPPSIYKWRESWGKYFARYLVEREKYYVMPYKPVATVYGERGTHSSRIELDVQVALDYGIGEYQFCTFEKGAHYDIFFENIDLKKMLADRFNIPQKEICIDIYGLRGRSYGKCKYVLSSRKMNSYIIDKFDLNLRPHEANVILDMKGNGIFFYDMTRKEKNKQIKSMRLEYDFAGIHGVDAIIYGCKHCIAVLVDCLRNK